MKPEVLIPGGHVDDSGEYAEIGNDDFVDAVLRALPDGVLHRKGDRVGVIEGEPGAARRFDELSSKAAVRLVVDRHVRLVKWGEMEAGGGRAKFYRPCTSDLAGLVRAAARTHPSVREYRPLAPDAGAA